MLAWPDRQTPVRLGHDHMIMIIHISSWYWQHQYKTDCGTMYTSLLPSSSSSSSSSSRHEIKRLRRQRVPLTVSDETKSYVWWHWKPWSVWRVNGTLQGDARRLTPGITYSDNVPTAVTGPHRQSDSTGRTALSRVDLCRQPLTFFCREGWMTRLSHTLCTAHLHTTVSYCHTVTVSHCHNVTVYVCKNIYMDKYKLRNYIKRYNNYKVGYTSRRVHRYTK